MPFRVKAFGLHLLGSICVLTLVLGGLYLGWYRWPGWYLSGVARVLIIVGIVDVALGPTLTLIIANPRKNQRALARDIAIIVILQIAALGYGAATLWQGRPLYYTFSAGSLDLVQASDINAKEATLGLKLKPELAPRWYSLPRWVYAPLPDNPEEAAKIVNSVVLGNGDDVIAMPRYFQPWDQGLPKLRQKLVPLAELKYFSKPEQEILKARMATLGVSAEGKNALVMWGGVGRRLLAVFDPESLKVRALIKPD